MVSVLLCALLAAGASYALVPMPGTSPWLDTSMCAPTDSLMMCQLKKGQCSPLNTVFSPPGGPIKTITDCANATGLVLGPQFFMSAGLAFITGSPESLPDKTTADTATATAIRRCALNSTGLLNADMVTVNRTVVAALVVNAFSPPALGAAVATAVATCPEPVDLKMSDFITCLRAACMSSVSGSPFIKMASAALTSPPIPPAIAAPLAAPLAKKPAPIPAPPKVAPPAPPKAAAPAAAPGAAAAPAGSTAYSAGGFAYPGVGAAPISPFGGVFPTSAYASSFMALPAAFEYPGMSPALTGAA